MRQFAYFRSWLLCSAIAMATVFPAVAAEVEGNVTKIDASSRSITLRGRTGEYSVTFKSAAKFWRVAPGHSDLQKAARDLKKATAITFEDISVGQHLLARGQRNNLNLLAAVIVAEGMTFTSLRNQFPWVKLAQVGKERAEVKAPLREPALFRGPDRTAANDRWVTFLRPGEEMARRAEAEARVHRAEEERAAAEQREGEFRNRILAAVQAAELPDPFSSIRGEFDLSASSSRHWKTLFQLSDAAQCNLIRTPPATPTSVSAWTLGCLFRVSGDGYEHMVNSAKTALNLPYQPDDRETRINRVFFANPSAPGWRLFVAKLNEEVVGVSLVAVRVAGEPPAVSNVELFPIVSTMLPIETTGSDEVGGVRAGQMGQSTVSAADCEAYPKGVRERASLQEEVRRLGTELSRLQMSSQDAMQQALESEQRAISNCSGGTGFLGGLKAVACAADRTTAQQKRAEAQSLQLQINQKQSQMSSSQTSLFASAPPVLPPGCRPDGTVIAAAPGSLSTGSAASPEPSVHDVVEKIRAADHAAMPPAQRVTVNALVAPGRTMMTVKNSTAYELSVFFDGPISTKLTIMPGASQDVDLAPGTFRVAGRVTAVDVLPFYGEETYSNSARYSVTFYVAP
jgi:hypothetical protein